MSTYIPVIGLEIHAELLTESKLFCSCSTEFGGGKNAHCCPGCAAMPGTLPAMNRKAVEFAIKAGYALNCSFNKFSVFDRKNYFYPDLPKAYQNSQLDLPLCINGLVNIEYEIDGVKKSKDIRINRIHLEEDAGKLIHDDLNGVSLADYNRGSIPLIEIVTEPDIGTAEEAKAFVEKISLLLQYAGVCDCKMEQGSLRCDVNISIMKPTDAKFGTRAEIKNLNSIKSIGRAVEYEIYRQERTLEMGGKIIQETRRFDDNKGETRSMRTKENAQDYRYFPDPDILQVNFTDEELESIRKTMPEMPYERLERYKNAYGLSEADSMIIIGQIILSDFYDNAVKKYDNPKSICNFITGEMMRRINLGEISLEDLPFDAGEFALLVQMADTEKVSKNDAKSIFRIMSEKGGNPEKIAKEQGYLITNDTGRVLEVIESVIKNNEKAVSQYKNGDLKVFGFLMGQCSKELKGVCTPKVIKDELENKLSAL